MVFELESVRASRRHVAEITGSRFKDVVIEYDIELVVIMVLVGFGRSGTTAVAESKPERVQAKGIKQRGALGAEKDGTKDQPLFSVRGIETRNG